MGIKIRRQTVILQYREPTATIHKRLTALQNEIFGPT